VHTVGFLHQNHQSRKDPLFSYLFFARYETHLVISHKPSVERAGCSACAAKCHLGLYYHGLYTRPCNSRIICQVLHHT
jgi:hypothetical protein